jgi:hypothetical protein
VTTQGRVLRLALLAIASAAILAGCGGGGADSGGLTPAERNAAQAAMDALQGSNIPTQILSLTSTAGQVPAACRVHLASNKPMAFKVYLFWIPYVGPSSYSWLDMTITKDASQDTFHFASDPSILPGGIGLGGNVAPVAGYQGYDHPLTYSLGSSYKRITQGVLKAHAGNVFSKPGAPCQVLMNGLLRMLPNP